MRKIFVFALSLGLILSLVACGGNAPPTPITTQTPQTSTPEPASNTTITDEPSSEIPSENDNSESKANSNILVAYFTVPETDGVDAVANASRVIVDGELFGNTQYLANVISETTGGDLFAIETVQEYPGEHNPLLDFAQEEQRRDARPELATHVENMADYDVIFLGYPNWWADLPQPLYTFLEEYDLSGKTIIPFCPHGGSRFSNTINTIAELQPDADVITNGYTVSRNNVSSSKNDINSWLSEMGY